MSGGARILQFRWKDYLRRELFEQAEQVAALCQAARVPLIVNDRADVAMMLGCGLHIGQDDIPPADARRLLGQGAVIGFSTHNEAQLRAASGEPVDYIAIGPIFATASKTNPDPVLGLTELKRLRPMVEGPLVAIGGITRHNAAEVWNAGAETIAVIGDLYPEAATQSSIRERMEEWMKIAPDE